MKLLLRNGRVVDPGSGTDETLDVLVEAGKIVGLERGIPDNGATVLDMSGLVVCPGFLDIHVHLREPGEEWKETIASGTAAAARGGFAGVACMPNTEPVNDCRSVTEYILSRARAEGAVPVYPIGCVTKGSAGEELTEMEEMREAGVCAFSDDGKPVRSPRMMRHALEYSKIFRVPIIDHCEEPSLVDGGVMNEGTVSTALGLKGWPDSAEDVMVQRNVLLAEMTGGHVHIAHMSTARSAGFVRDGKAKGIRVTCEVTPHHLILTDEAVQNYDTDAKMNPPLRDDRDLAGLLEALADGTVDAIATDHAPHHPDEKRVEFSRAPFGVVGLETAVSLCLDRLVRSGKIEMKRMVELFTSGPADVLGLDRGRLRKGGPADITVIDPVRQVTVDPSKFRSKSRNTPFGSWKLCGAAVLTIVGGRIVHDERGVD